MLKNAFTALVIGTVLSLTGCSQVEVVTEDMLIGKWQCDLIKKTVAAYDDNGVLGEAIEEPNKDRVSFQHYVEENNTMMVVFANGERAPFVFKDKAEGKLQPFGHNEKIKVDQAFIFVSNDQFKFIMDITVLQNDAKRGLEMHQEELCSRINAE